MHQIVGVVVQGQRQLPLVTQTHALFLGGRGQIGDVNHSGLPARPLKRDHVGDGFKGCCAKSGDGDALCGNRSAAHALSPVCDADSLPVVGVVNAYPVQPGLFFKI